MTDYAVNIISGPQGTGKGFIAQALKAIEPASVIVEVSSLDEVAEALSKAGKDSIVTLVCTDTFTFTPHDLFLAKGIKISSSHLIHLSHCLMCN